MPFWKRGGVVFTFLWLTSILAGQENWDRPVSLTIEELPVAEALLRISEAADVDLTFSPHFFKPEQVVSVQADGLSLSRILDICLEGTGIGYQYEDRQIILVRRQFSVHGYLVDAVSGERLVGGHVRVLGASRGTYTNSYGFFSLTLPAGNHRLAFSYLGYQPREVPVSLLSDRQLTVNLAGSLTLDEVVVAAPSIEKAIERRESLPLATLQQMPNSLGEPDLFRDLDFLPGVQTGADGFSGLSVRGGSIDQNLILLDDVPIFHPTHGLGFLSIFNPELIRNVRFYKDGVPARYSGRLSSVLDVRSREGNNRQFGGQLGVGTLASQAVLEGPLVREKGAWLVAARRTHIDPLVQWWGDRQKAEEGQTGNRTYAFYDLNLKSYYQLSDRDKIFLSFYTGGDRFFDSAEETGSAADSDSPLPGFDQFRSTEYGYEWGNQIGSLRWNHLFGNRLFSNLTLISSRFTYANESSYQSEVRFQEFPILAYQQQSQFQSDIRKQALRLDMDYFGKEHRWQWGGHLAALTYTPGLSSFQEQEQRLDSLSLPELSMQNDTVRLNTWEGGIYLEDRFSWGRLDLQLGFHGSALFSSDTLFWGWQPRLALDYHLHPAWRVGLKAMRSVQFLHLLTTISAGLPNDLWVPATRDMPPQTAWQLSANLRGQLKGGWSAEIGIFGKRMWGLPFFRNGLLTEEAGLQIDAGNWEEIAFAAEGEAYGLECLLSRAEGTLRPWIAYTFSESKRFVEQRLLPFAFNHRHRLVTALEMQFSGGLSGSVAWQYFSGAPFSPVLSEGQELSFFRLLPGGALEEGRDRLPDYHRLDVQVTYEWGKGKWRHAVSAGVYNAYNRSNGLFLLRRDVVDPNKAFELQQIDGLPAMPNLRYQLRFGNRK